MTGSEYICAPELVRAFFPCFYSSVTKRKPELQPDCDAESIAHNLDMFSVFQ